MRTAGRLQAAIEVLDLILTRHATAAGALSDWGKAHRFAGAGDRAAIGNLVYDALRRRLSVAHAMGGDSPRGLAIGAAPGAWDLAPAAVADLCDGVEHAPAPLDERERAGLLVGAPEPAPPHVAANIPEWLWPELSTRFGEGALAEGEALARRAPLDLRVNTLKASPDKVLAALASFGATATPHAPLGIRIAPPTGGGRTPNVQVEAGFQKGWFEVQDEGSQIAATIAAAIAKDHGQVLDLCAGAGGKTLAMAAALANKGQIHATDADRVRLAPIHERLKRAGVHNVQVHAPRSAGLEALAGRIGTVIIDAPCTGTGVWRRRPEAKWRLSAEALQRRLAEQREILDQAVGFLKPGGAIVYITCSLLRAENEDQVTELMSRHSGFAARPGAALWEMACPGGAPEAVHCGDLGLTLTPARTGTDGFFVAVLER